MNLIKKLGGYENAKNEHEKLKLNLTQKQRENKIFMDAFNSLSCELLEHRRQHNIFEPDDYIIHDGELKVFAMWSSAVEGCAYIGYAYAENGEMAHKDEFRHATPEEIKAGRRL